MADGRTEDRPVRFDVGGRGLTGMLHLPRGERRGPAVLLCNAFGDERKSSALAMARLARALAGEGRAALCFDYWGCGDSPGDFVEATVSTRLADIRAASDFLLQQAGGERLCLLGLRLGATLAVNAAPNVPGCESLILIEPIPDGAVYVDAMLRRRAVRRMITSGHGDGDADADDTVDLDGYALRRATIEGIRSLRIAQPALPWPVLLVQASFSERLRSETISARDALQSAGACVDVQSLVLPPFWSRVDITDTSSLDRTVTAWMERAART